MPRHLKIASFILLVLTVFFLLTHWPRAVEDKTESQALLPFAFDDVSRVRLNHFVEGYEFKRGDGGRWQIRQIKNELAAKIEAQDGKSPAKESDWQKADALAVTRALSPLFSIHLDEAVATGKSQEKLFEINEYSLSFECFDKTGLLLKKIRVGKSGPDIFSSFIMIDGQAGIYLINQNLQALLWHDFKDWLPKSESK